MGKPVHSRYRPGNRKSDLQKRSQAEVKEKPKTAMAEAKKIDVAHIDKYNVVQWMDE